MSPDCCSALTRARQTLEFPHFSILNAGVLQMLKLEQTQIVSAVPAILPHFYQTGSNFNILWTEAGKGQEFCRKLIWMIYGQTIPNSPRVFNFKV